jgi:hypothetical protein
MQENLYRISLLNIKIVRIIMKNLGKKECKLDFSKFIKVSLGIIFDFFEYI